jgi:hypothetical protein
MDVTGQVLHLAREAGVANVHDYLVLKQRPAEALAVVAARRYAAAGPGRTGAQPLPFVWSPGQVAGKTGKPGKASKAGKAGKAAKGAAPLPVTPALAAAPAPPGEPAPRAAPLSSDDGAGAGDDGVGAWGAGGAEPQPRAAGHARKPTIVRKRLQLRPGGSGSASADAEQEDGAEDGDAERIRSRLTTRFPVVKRPRVDDAAAAKPPAAPPAALDAVMADVHDQLRKVQEELEAKSAQLAAKDAETAKAYASARKWRARAKACADVECDACAKKRAATLLLPVRSAGAVTAGVSHGASRGAGASGGAGGAML